MEALCLLLGVKWQPLSGRALGPSCLLNKIHGNRLPCATEILGDYHDCRWLTIVVSILFTACHFPSGKSHQDSHHFIQTTHLCSWSLGILVVAQDPTILKGASRALRFIASPRDWQFCPLLSRVRALHTEITGDCGPAAFGIHMEVLYWQHWLRKFRPSANVCL